LSKPVEQNSQDYQDGYTSLNKNPPTMTTMKKQKTTYIRVPIAKQ
jgi:hypothetical protein